MAHNFQRMVSDANKRTVHGFRDEQVPSTTDVSSFTNIINKTANRQLKQKEEVLFHNCFLLFISRTEKNLCILFVIVN